jgi:bacterioferritin-associated ferredoxin
MIVCHCTVVTDRAISQAVSGGARTLGQVCQSTGAGKDCGACVFSVKRLMCDAEHHVGAALQGRFADVQAAAG